MKKSFKKALAVLLSVMLMLTSLLVPMAGIAKTNTEKRYNEGEAIAVLEDTADSRYFKASQAKALYGKGFSLTGSYTFGSGKDALKVVVLKSKTMTTKQMLRKLKENDAVNYALPNYKMYASEITDDTYSKYQWALDNTGQNGGTVGCDTNADTLWEAAAASEQEQVVAIVDTGIDFENEDLQAVLWNNPYGSKLLGQHGLDFTSTIEDGTPYDDNGHGSHCAGIIAAQANNQAGISGINTSNTKIMALKFLDAEGSGYLDDALAAYEYIMRAVKLGTNVIACNNSWGGAGDAEEMELFNSLFDKLGELGVISFVAAGNESTDISEPYSDIFDEGEYYDLPACSTSQYCVTVAATNESDELADFSNYSEKFVDIAAPGTAILSTVSYDCFNPTIYDAAKRDALTDYDQTFEAPLTDGDFGYLHKVDYTGSDFKSGVNYTVSQTGGFGTEGEAIQLTFTDTIKNDDAVIYAFEVPFTVPEEVKDYSISVVYKGDGNFECPVYDVPADVTAQEALDNHAYDVLLYGGEVANYWDHTFTDILVDDEDFGYEKATDRKLIFLFAITSKDTTVVLDDLAISAQDADAEDFGKYDFYCGTSMATPYATGAAALIKNAKPDADPLEVINIIKNTGRYSAALEGKTQNAKVLSLDNIEAIPPMITDAGYNEDKNIAITGSFKDITGVTVNGEAVTPISVEKNLIIIPDNNYSTKKLLITVTNEYGEDSITTFVSDKPGFTEVELAEAPYMYGGYAVPAGEYAYFVSSYGTIGAASLYEGEYEYYELGDIDFEALFDSYDGCGIYGAVYLSGHLYVYVINQILSQYTGQTLGYETALLKVDPETLEAEKVAEIPDEIMMASSLAVFNGDIYLIGGLNRETYALSDAVYKLNTADGVFEKQATSLPQARAATKFIQYKDKLIGLYGAVSDGSFPQIIVFDGESWTESSTVLESDDADFVLPIDEETTYYFYSGNLGYNKTGIIANGAYIYGYGDTLSYRADVDKVYTHKYCARNAIEEPRLIGTTVPGGFIGFPIESAIIDDDEFSYGSRYLPSSLIKNAEYEDYDDDYDDEDYDDEGGEESCVAYTLRVNNIYPTIDTDEIVNATVTGGEDWIYTYGDAVKLTIKPDAGYVNKTIKNNDEVIGTAVNTVTIIPTEPENVITNDSALIVSAVTSVKVTESANGTYTISWNKAAKGKGYQIMQYNAETKKWETIKTINNINTTSCKLTNGEGNIQLRVRAFGTYSGKKVYGKLKGKTIYIPKQQTIQSVSGGTGKFTVKYTKDVKATGYNIQYTTSTSDFSNAKSVYVTDTATLSKTISSLSAGKYRVRVRSYKVVDGVKIFGKFTPAVTVTVK